MKKNEDINNINMKTYPILGNLTIPEYVIYHLKKIKVSNQNNNYLLFI